MKQFKIALGLLVILFTLALNGCGEGGGGSSSSGSNTSGGGSGISSTKDISSYQINGVPATIDEASNSIKLILPYGTDLTNLVATFNAIGDVKVGSTEEASGKTPNNFTNPVDYKITATDGSTRDFMVTVTAASSSAKDITSYQINGVPATIDEANNTIKLTLPFGANLTNLVATFNAIGDVKVGNTEEVSGTTTNNFTKPVDYKITAPDGSTRDFMVTVTAASSSAKDITNYQINGVPAIIDEANNTISLTLSSGTDLTNLVATFTAIGDVKVGSTEEASGTTANDFTKPVIYTIIASDKSSRNFTVTVKKAGPSVADITSYKIDGVIGIINETDKTISLTLPAGTDLTHLIATFTALGDVKVGNTEEVSATTVNDFSKPVMYTVTSPDKLATVNFTVTVTTDKPPLPPITPCTNHTCTGLWSLDKSPGSPILNGGHPGATCDASVIAKESLDSDNKHIITLTGKAYRHTCYVIIPGVFGGNPNHVYLEATVKVSSPQGNPDQTWPAFWTTGANWPYNGEIDIAEGNVNSGFSSLVTWTNLHGRHGASQGPSQKYAASGLSDFNDWHIYGMELLKDPVTMHIEIATYLDGNRVTYFNNSGITGDNADDYKDIINGFSTHNIVFDADNNSNVEYSMDVKNVNAYEVH